MTLQQEDLAVGAEGEVGRLVQQTRTGGFVPFTGLALRAEREQHIALPAHLGHRVAVDVGHPEIALRVDAEAVRPHEGLLLSDRANERAIGVEFQERIRSAVEHDQVPI